MTTFNGSSTAIIRKDRLFKSSRRQCSNSPSSMMPFVFETPMRPQKSRIASGVYPRRLTPEMVGIRGSSHPDTTPFCTSIRSLRLLNTVLVKFKRSNSICCG